jgi:hypothetical protein
VLQRLRDWVVETAAARLHTIRASGDWDRAACQLALRYVELLVAQGRKADARLALVEALRQVSRGREAILVCIGHSVSSGTFRGKNKSVYICSKAVCDRKMTSLRQAAGLDVVVRRDGAQALPTGEVQAVGRGARLPPRDWAPPETSRGPRNIGYCINSLRKVFFGPG